MCTLGFALFKSLCGFSCDVISSKCYKWSNLWPPCWFPFARAGIGKHKKMSCYFYLVHITIPNYNRVTSIAVHTLGEIVNSAMKLIKNNSLFCCFTLYRAVQKGNQGVGQNRVRISKCVPIMQALWHIEQLCLKVTRPLFNIFNRPFAHVP